MLGGLYGDLPQAKQVKEEENGSGSTPGAWAANKLAPPMRKPAFGAPSSVLRGAGRARGAGRIPGKPEPRPGEAATGRGAGPGTSSFAALSSNVVDEYDPTRPNDYEEVSKERERLRREADEEAERQERLKQMQKEQEEREERERYTQRSPPRAADREEVLGVSGEEAYARRARLSRPGSGFSDSPAPVAPAAPAGLSFAEKMMQKMGWSEGEGLGKNRQGMITPLVAQKTGGRTGVIANAEARDAAERASKRAKGVALQGTPTKVVCMRNMVGPGEVDEDLEDEVGNECSKYGTVTRVLIFEVTEPGYPVEEAVRIFVEFDRVEAATKALIDLAGRFFGGRTVRASFFDEQKFDRGELAPMAGEFDPK
ncbi:hypothetical protein WJX72_010226 [[Myrmecia] bisecta]|uniref:Splicing factor 45 n=1 Tax=[Myrmecia] bisecta TaxID=41462 RepID=A0AAW1R975_9CHLO